MSALRSPGAETASLSAPPTANPERPRSGPRILYVDGPGNVLGTFQKWTQGQHDSNEVSFAFSEEFFSLAEDLDAEVIVVASNDQPGHIKQGRFTVLHQPVPSRMRGGFAYHLGEIGFALWLVRTAVRWRADVIIVADRMYWFALWPATIFRIRIIAMLHNMLWPPGSRPSTRAFRILSALNGLFWRNFVESALCVSPEIERQYTSVMGVVGPFHQVRPQYFPEVFASVAPPPPIDGVLRIFFAGRLERGKGIFDLLEIATRLHAQRPGEFHFELAGTGSACEELRQKVLAAGLESSFLLLGKLQMDGMALAYGRCHAIIVPTNSGFTEGLNRVCIEAILAHRPVITSEASGGTDVLTAAIIKVPVDDIEAYVLALQSLKDDPALYQRLSIATEKYTAPFYDRSQGYRSCLRRAVERIAPSTPPSPTSR